MEDRPIDTGNVQTHHMQTDDMRTERELAARRATYLTGLLWHVGEFLIINGFLWLIDLVLGPEGLDWALWITAVWGFALAFHVLAHLIDGRQMEARKAADYLRRDGVER